MANSKLILLKYDTVEKSSKPSGTAIIQGDINVKTLEDIREVLLEQKTLDKKQCAHDFPSGISS